MGLYLLREASLSILPFGRNKLRPYSPPSEALIEERQGITGATGDNNSG